MLDRRDLLGAMGAGLIAGAGLNARASEPTAASRIPQSPRDRLFTYTRILATLNGETCLATEGLLHGQPAGGLAEPLCGFLTLVAVKTFQTADDRFSMRQREAVLFVDLDSGEQLTTFHNPYTGETLTPFGHVSSIYEMSFDTRGRYMDQRPAARPADWTLIWRATDNALIITETRHNRAPAGITEAEFPRAYGGAERVSIDNFSYEAEFADLARPTAEFVPARTHLLTQGPWQFWLMMGRRPGEMIWDGAGRKYQRIGDAPTRALHLIEAAYPGFVEDPWAPSMSEFGKLAQMRRLKAQGKL